MDHKETSTKRSATSLQAIIFMGVFAIAYFLMAEALQNFDLDKKLKTIIMLGVSMPLAILVSSKIKKPNQDRANRWMTPLESVMFGGMVAMIVLLLMVVFQYFDIDEKVKRVIAFGISMPLAVLLGRTIIRLNRDS
jgi:surface polysaccharide O-acyltransferase-like enzyme